MKTLTPEEKILQLKHDLYYIITDVKYDRRTSSEAINIIMKLVNEIKAEYEELLRWIPVEEELPEIKDEPYQIIGKLAANGQYETYWVYQDTTNIEKECTHWRKINYENLGK